MSLVTDAKVKELEARLRIVEEGFRELVRKMGELSPPPTVQKKKGSMWPLNTPS